MRSRLVRCLWLTCILLTPFATWAGTPEPGASGYALTAIRGSVVERIPVEYVGALTDASGPGHDLHLVRLRGPVGESVGVASGMSGSPVYFDGELLGALSYRIGTLPTDPIAGVTPIEHMREAHRFSAEPAIGARPIATPVVATGLAEPVRAWLGPQLEEMGLTLTAGGGQAGEIAPHLEAGGPVGVELIRGTASIAATGTVTLIEDDVVYAFGHPFFGNGPVELPMVAAEVVITLGDLAGSAKLANVGPEVGAILDDRASAIVGRLDRRVRLVPIDVTLRYPDEPGETFRSEIARAGRLGPTLAGVAVVNTLLTHVAYDGETTMIVRGRVNLRDREPIPFEAAHTGVGASDPAFAAAGEVQRIFSALWANSLAVVPVESVEVEIEIRPGIAQYRLESIHYDRGPVRPGQTLRLRCVLSRYRGDDVTRDLMVPIPADARDGETLRLLVGPPSQIDRALGRPTAAGLATVEDPDRLVELLRHTAPANRLTATVTRGDATVVRDGALFTGLPPTAERLLTVDRRISGARALPYRSLATASVTLDAPVRGGIGVRLRVDSRPDADVEGDGDVGEDSIEEN